MNKTKSSVSYILSPENVPQHRLGINSLALDPHKRLYTASRDSSVKVWNTAHSNVIFLIIHSYFTLYYIMFY